MSFGYGPAGDKQDDDRADPAAVERGVTFFDTAEVYGPFTNEELVGEALAPVRDQVVIATKFGFKIDGNGHAAGPGQPAGAHQGGRRGVAQAAQDRPHRPVLPAPRRPERADRGRRGRGEGADRARARSSTSACPRPARRRSAARTRCSPSPRCRASTRCGGASPRQEILPTLEELGIGFVPFSPLGQGLPHRQDRREHDVRQAPTSATSSRASRRRPARRTRRWSICSARSRRARRRRRRRSRSPGCWRRSRGSCRSRARPSCTAWRRTSARRPSSSPPATCGDRGRLRDSRCRASATRSGSRR